MTDFELVYLLNEYSNAIQTALMNYVAVLSAFLIAGYLVSARLTANMVFIVVALFTLAVTQQLWFVFIVSNNLLGVGGQIVERVAIDPSGLDWHGAVMVFKSSSAGPYAIYNTLALEIIGYLGALIFFFHQRHVGKTE